MAEIKLYTLGSPRIEVDGALVEVDTRKAVALLVYLALTGKAHSREALTALLWPEYDTSNARAALRRTLSALRKSLGQDLLEATNDTVGLLPNINLWLDVHVFRRLLEECGQHGHPARDVCTACLAPLSEAATLYRADFLAGFGLRDSSNFDDWQFFQAESLRRELQGLLERLARGLSAKGDFTTAVSAARRWLSLDTLSEEAQRQLILCYAWSGQRNAALRQYRECVHVLDAELGVTPLEETSALYQSILKGRLQPPPLLADDQPAGSPSPNSLSQPARVPSHPFPRGEAGVAPAYPLVGRSSHSVELVRAYQKTVTDGFFLALEGEAGIGKTRLAEEFLAYVRSRDGWVLSVRCYEGESYLAYGPFVEALIAALRDSDRARQLEGLSPHWLSEAARLVPELEGLIPSELARPGVPLEGPGAQSRFFEGLRQVIVRICQGDCPGVLFLDDLHWADVASLDLLTYLVRRLRDAPIFILVTWRSEGSPASIRLHALLAEAQRANHGALLRLSRLSPSDVEDLVRTMLIRRPDLPRDFSRRLFEETEGLPFFVVEYLENLAQAAAKPGEGSGVWPIPGSVRDLLRSRLAAAGETGWQLLDTAAVIGRSFDFNTLREASGRSEIETINGLEELLDLGLIVERASEESGAISDSSAISYSGAISVSGFISYDFMHDKLRTFVLNETSLTRRRLLHRRVADALVAGSRSQQEFGAISGQIAYHYHQAGQASQAAEYFRRAGEYALRLYANVEALAHFRAALDSGHPQAAALHENIADLHVLAGDYNAALTHYEHAAALTKSNDLSRLEHKLGVLHHHRGAWELAIGHFRAATDLLTVGQASERLAAIYADWSRTAYQQGRIEQAMELAHNALDLAHTAGDAAGLARAYNILGILARRRNDPVEANCHLQRSLEIARELNDPVRQVAALNNLALLYGDGGDMEGAVRTAQTALEICQRVGDRHHEAALLNNLADLYHAAGQPAESMEYLKKAVIIFAEIGAPKNASPAEIQSEIWKLTEW